MKSIVSILIIFLSCQLQAQPSSSGKIFGNITDIKKEGIPYATISLYDEQENFISGTISDEKGNYLIEKLALVSYVVKAEYLGLLDYKEKITLSKANKKAEMKIVMKEDVAQLEEVVVTAEKSSVSLRLGKKEFQVGKDLLSQGGDALKVLNQVPSVSVDPSGTVLLRGSSAVQILINGRRSGMTMNNALEQIPAENIEKVEVITNPSASFDAEGSAGIINLILKKDKGQGWNGQLALRAGTPADHSVMPSINYKTKKFNAFANLRWRYSDYKGIYLTEQEISLGNGLTRLLDQDQRENRHDDGRSIYTGTDIYVSDKSTLTLAYYRSETKDSDETNLDYSITEDDKYLSLIRLGSSIENRDYNQIELSYSHKLKKAGQKWSIELQNDFWNSTKDWNLKSSGSFTASTIANDLRTKNRSRSNDYVAKTDYVHPIGMQSNLEIGAKMENRIVESDYIAESLEGSEWNTFAGIDNALDYEERIGAIYLQYNTKIKKLDISVGLRSEFTDLSIEDKEQNYTDSRSYNNLFPSASLSTQLSERHSLQLSYSRRINRPSLWSLYPFTNITDFNQQDIGNPNLRAAFADAMELSFLHIFEKLTINTSLYYKKIEDPTSYVVTYTSDEIFLFEPINIDQRQETGFETSIKYSPFSWLRLRGDFNLLHFEQSGMWLEKELSNNNFYYETSISAETKLKNDLSFSSRFQYRGKENSPLFETLASSILSFGINKSFLNDRISIGFDAFNVLDTRIQKTVAVDSQYKFEYSSRRYGPRYSFNFSYKFNQSDNQRMRRENRANRY